MKWQRPRSPIGVGQAARVAAPMHLHIATDGQGKGVRVRLQSQRLHVGFGCNRDPDLPTVHKIVYQPRLQRQHAPVRKVADNSERTR